MLDFCFDLGERDIELLSSSEIFKIYPYQGLGKCVELNHKTKDCMANQKQFFYLQFYCRILSSHRVFKKKIISKRSKFLQWAFA